MMGSLFSNKKNKKGRSPLQVANVAETSYKHLLSPNEIALLRKYFLKAAGGDRVISFQEFVELFGFLNPQCIGPYIVNIAERAFIASDLNFDGYVTYDEFVAAYVLSKGNRVPIPVQARPGGYMPTAAAPPFYVPMIPQQQFLPPPQMSMIPQQQFLPPPPPPPQMSMIPHPQFVPPPQMQMIPYRPAVVNNNFRDNLISLLRIQSSQHERPGYLNSNEAYYYINWLHRFYGSPTRYPEPDVAQKYFTSKKHITYTDFADFIEPYYRRI